MEICERLHFSAVMRNCIVDANWATSELPRLCSELSTSRIVEKLDDLREEALFVVWVGMPDRPDCREIVDKYLSEWRFVSPITTGDTLREMGLPPSSTYRKILQTLRDAWLDGEVKSPEEENALLSTLVKNARGQR